MGPAQPSLLHPPGLCGEQTRPSTCRWRRPTAGEHPGLHRRQGDMSGGPLGLPPLCTAQHACRPASPWSQHECTHCIPATAPPLPLQREPSPQVASLQSSGLQHRNAMGPLWPRSTCRRTTTLPAPLPATPLPLPPAPPPAPLPPPLPPPGLPLLLPLGGPLRSTSQMMAVWSLPHEASMRPLWEKARCHTSSVWSNSTCDGRV